MEVWNKEVKKYKSIYIGVDQSYANPGISIVCDGVLRDIKSVPLNKCKTHTDCRRVLSQKLDSLLARSCANAEQVTCICEATRLHGGPTSFINIDAIKAMGSLITTIVDVGYIHGVKTYSVDTRCWKSQVVGTSKSQPNKYGVPDEKWPTVRWVIEQGFEDKILIELPAKSRKKKGTFVHNGVRYMYNHDAADSAGIAMFGVVGDPNKLQEER